MVAADEQDGETPKSAGVLNEPSDRAGDATTSPSGFWAAIETDAGIEVGPIIEPKAGTPRSDAPLVVDFPSGRRRIKAADRRALKLGLATDGTVRLRMLRMNVEYRSRLENEPAGLVAELAGEVPAGRDRADIATELRQGKVGFTFKDDDPWWKQIDRQLRKERLAIVERTAKSVRYRAHEPRAEEDGHVVTLALCGELEPSFAVLEDLRQLDSPELTERLTTLLSEYLDPVRFSTETRVERTAANERATRMVRRLDKIGKSIELEPEVAVRLLSGVQALMERKLASGHLVAASERVLAGFIERDDASERLREPGLDRSWNVVLTRSPKPSWAPGAPRRRLVEWLARYRPPLVANPAVWRDATWADLCNLTADPAIASVFASDVLQNEVVRAAMIERPPVSSERRVVELLSAPDPLRRSVQRDDVVAALAASMAEGGPLADALQSIRVAERSAAEHAAEDRISAVRSELQAQLDDVERARDEARQAKEAADRKAAVAAERLATQLGASQSDHTRAHRRGAIDILQRYIDLIAALARTAGDDDVLKTQLDIHLGHLRSFGVVPIGAPGERSSFDEALHERPDVRADVVVIIEQGFVMEEDGQPSLILKKAVVRPSSGGN